MMADAPPEAQASCSTATFGPAVHFPAGLLPKSMAVGDFNGDLSPDVAAVNFNSDSVTIYAGNGTGGLGSRQDLPVGANPFSIAKGDFDHDGDLDLAVVNNRADNVSILKGDGAGNFSLFSTAPAGRYPLGLAVGLIDDDDDLDLAVANYGSNNVSILLGSGTGTFSSAGNVVAGNQPYFPVIGDLNGDSNSDLAVANYASNNVSILLGNGGSSFVPLAPVSVGTNPESIAVGDFNSDGFADLAVADFGSDTVSLRLGLGNGQFISAAPLPAGEGPQHVATGDFNADGKLDLVVTNNGGGADGVSVFLGNGTLAGTFRPRVSFDAGSNPYSVEAADFNLDGQPDLVISDSSSNTLSILLNTCQPNCPGIFGSTTNFPAAFNPWSIAAGHLDADANLDIVLGNASSSDSVSILSGDGLGAFGLPSTFPTGPVGAVPQSVVTADFDADGRGDVAVANYIADTVAVLLGTGGGGLATPLQYPVGNRPVALAVGSFDATSKLDLAVACELNGEVWTMTDDVAFPPFRVRDSFPSGTAPIAIATGMFNSDGFADLVVANQSDVVTVLLGEGAGQFGAPVSYSIAPMFSAGADGPYSVAVGYFNSDMNADLAVTENGTNQVRILLGFGNGAFGGAVGFDVGTFPASVAVGDFNADGKDDLVVANYYVDFLSVLLGNGAGGFAKAINFPSGTNPYDVVVGDFNNDGGIDVASANTESNDVSILLNSKCTSISCGNGVRSADEECDDGNLVGGDRCASNCTIETVIHAVSAGGTATTDPLGVGATPEFPIQASATTPGGGTVTFDTLSPVGQTVPAFEVLGLAMHVTAPPATPSNPLVLVFTIDSTVIPVGMDPATLLPTRNGQFVTECRGDPGEAKDDPCMESVVVLPNGDIQITVLTSAASVWEFGAPACGCDGPTGGGSWRDHGDYIRCVREALRSSGTGDPITRQRVRSARRAAVRSTCGREPLTRCCLATGVGATCRIRLPASCATANGSDIGAGSCVPDPCSAP